MRGPDFAVVRHGVVKTAGEKPPVSRPRAMTPYPHNLIKREILDEYLGIREIVKTSRSAGHTASLCIQQRNSSHINLLCGATLAGTGRGQGPRGRNANAIVNGSKHSGADAAESGRESVVGVRLQSDERWLGCGEATARGIRVGVLRRVDAIQIDRDDIAAHLNSVLIPSQHLRVLRLHEVSTYRRRQLWVVG